MTNQTTAQKATRILWQRVACLCNDGYILRTRYTSPRLACYQLQHQKNENRIVILAHPADNEYKQYVNGKCKHGWQKIITCSGT